MCSIKESKISFIMKIFSKGVPYSSGTPSIVVVTTQNGIVVVSSVIRVSKTKELFDTIYG